MRGIPRAVALTGRRGMGYNRGPPESPASNRALFYWSPALAVEKPASMDAKRGSEWMTAVGAVPDLVGSPDAVG